jgi:putative FmdB family regulatory protein
VLSSFDHHGGFFVPTYSYSCTECDNKFDVVQAFSDDALTECPKCEGRLRKLFGKVGVVFKGSGFYRNDSREAAKSASNGSSKSTESAASGSSDSSSSSASADKKSESTKSDSSSSSSSSTSTSSSTSAAAASS